MVSPTFAAVVVISFVVVFGLFLPILNRFAPKFVSYRWCVVVAVMAVLIGVVMDFDGLSEDARSLVLTGGMIICGGYVFLRTVEKSLANGWLRGAKIQIKKGDASATVSGGAGDADK